ncbi:MAG: sensor histidine kinase [Pseudomonadota bacterium]
MASATCPREIVARLGILADTAFGAGAPVVVVRPDTRLHGCARNAPEASALAEAGAITASHEIEHHLRAGCAGVYHQPAQALPDLNLPASAALAALLPCPGTRLALCLHWPEPKRTLSVEARTSLDLIAALAGLALDKASALARARASQAALENRLRNFVALMRSVGVASAEKAEDLDAFLLHYEGRLDALARTQLAVSRGEAVSFELLLREELFAQTIQDSPRVVLRGLDVLLGAHEAETLGLVLHELAVNAVKYGAFSRSGGRLDVRWWMDGGTGVPVLRLDWGERVPQGIAPPEKTGFGLTVIEKLLPYQLDARVDLDFATQGFRCRAAVPLALARQDAVLRRRTAMLN